jgi:serralysin
MRDLPFQRLAPADFQAPGDPQVSYDDDYIEYRYGGGNNGRVWRFEGDFQFDLDGADVVDVAGTVTRINYRFDFTDPFDPGGVYWGEYAISGASVDVSAFQALDDAALAALIFSGNDTIAGTSYDDFLLGLGGADVIKGGNGHDTVDGGLGADTMYGGAGYDTYVVDDAGDVVIEYAGQGEDTVQSSVSFTLGSYTERLRLFGGDNINGTGNELANEVSGNSGANTLLGRNGDDYVGGNDGNDRISGGSGDDFLRGGAGADFLSGGAGSDTAGYDDATAGVVVDLLNPANNQGDAAGDTFDSIEKLVGSNYDDTLVGNAEANILDGGKGANSLFGGQGDDTLFGGEYLSVNHLDGGAGSDTVSYETVLYGHVVVDLQTPANNQGNATGDTFNSIENVRGTENDDRLIGNAEANRLEGGSGADRLVGGEGDDTLVGGEGRDGLSGGTGSDTASYASASGRVVAQFLTPANNEGDAAGDTYNSIENIIGSNFDDGLVGTAGGNRLDGGKGADRIFGIEGNDTLTGGEGADYLSGGLGTDTASYASATARVIVSLANTAINTGDAAGDTFNSIENLLGSAFDDYVYGNNAVNVIKGGAGNDIIKGYGGNDTLAGNSGQDIFVFNTALNASTNVDTITDFNVAADTIWLDDLFFTALSTGPLAAAAFRANATGLAQDADDRIVYNTSTGELSYDSDGNGAGGSVLFARLTAGLALASADFVVI